MRVSSIYPMIQGEGKNVGVPMWMIRLQGCPLKCKLCDSKYTWDPNGGTEMSINEIIEEVKKCNLDWVDISGGEPLYQETELYCLILRLMNTTKMKIEIETSGFYPPPKWWGVECWSVDWKMRSSGGESKALNKWLSVLSEFDSIKCVVSDADELNLILKNKPITKASLIISPVIWDIKETSGEIIVGKEQLKWIRTVYQFCQDNNLRFSMQNHKLVFGQERRDV